MRRERPDWPIDRPLAVVAKTRNALRVVAADAAAHARAVSPGLTLKDARARAPDLLTAPLDAAADAQALRALLAACRRFTPSLSDPAPDALVLDVSGAGALFGGEAALLARVRAVFAQAAVRLRPGLADTPGLAWALARFADDPVSPPGAGEAALQPLPAEALGLSAEDLADLQALGFRRVGEVMARPRALLAEALEGRLGQRLDEMLGLRACPLTLRLEPEHVTIDRPLLHAVSGADALLHHVRRMAEGIERQLERRRLGGRVFRLTLFGERGLQRQLEVRARRPLTRPAEVAALFARRFEGVLEIEGAGEDEAFDHLRLEARRSEPLQAQTCDLLDDYEGEARFEAFVASLAARFGREAVEVIVADPRSALPEREARFAPLGARPGAGPCAPPPAFGDAVLRPLRLFDRPQPIEVLAGVPDDPPATIVWRRVHRRILKAEGPERLTAEWARQTSPPKTGRDSGCASGRAITHARLLSRGGCGRSALLGVPRRPLRRGAHAALVPARAVRVSPRPAPPRPPLSRRAWPADLRAPAAGPAYVELAAATAFSFLRGASHPHEMVGQAWELGHAAAAVADLNTLAGVVRAHKTAGALWESLGLREDDPDRPPPFRLCVGARLRLVDLEPEVLVYPSDREAFARLTTLLTRGGMESGARKGEAVLTLEDLLRHARGQNLILIPPDRPDAPALEGWAERLLEASDGRAWLAGVRRFDAVDEMRLDLVALAAEASGAPLIAVNDAAMHHPSRKRLLDVMTCIREHVTLEEAGRRLDPNAERHLKSPAEMARLFQHHPAAIGETARFAELCDLSLGELAYDYPDEPVPPGVDAQTYLERLAWAGADWRYPPHKHPAGVPAKVRQALEMEFAFIRKRRYANYFLTVHDIVRWARDHGILCQGRGSAANSVVCFCLGVTSVDPTDPQTTLLFSRFISDEREEPPDIDIDFEHARREDVIQYIYRRYGRHRAAICATVIHYRPRMAIREVGKVFGLSEDVTAGLASTIWGSWGDALPDAYVEQAGLDPTNAHLRGVLALANDLIGFPRHLSQHVGGFVLTQRLLSETCPIVNAAMPDRTFVEWDKDDIDHLGIMKVDVLALGMLTAIKKAFNLLVEQGALPDGADMADLPPHQPDVFRMCAEADTVGVFQIESRAQMNMLPRLKPETFYDLVIEVAIVRPGPIQGDMVHPYLRRKAGLEEVEYPRPAPPHDPRELEDVLSKTLGVPLFQEQVMQVAMTAADFSGAEADGLRRAMATFKRRGGMGAYYDKLIQGMSRKGYEPRFAEQIFKQIEGFGSYGFPESHAASFAKLVYVSAYLKARFPAVFCVALLNSQPMGFYAPAQLVRDALEHGVEVRPVDVEHSDWDCTLETDAGGVMAVRLGLRQIDGLSESWAKVIPERRGAGYGDFDGFIRRTGLTRAQVRRLAEADAFTSFEIGRRGGVWQSLKVTKKAPAPLLAPLPRFTRPPELPALAASEEVVADYRTTRLSLKGHPMAFLRSLFAGEGARPCGDLVGMRDAQPVSTAGVVLVRQRPGNGRVCFITVEDETGVANLVVVMEVFERYRAEIMSARLLVAHGRIQKSPEGVTHVFVHRLENRSGDLGRLTDPGEAEFQPAIARADHVATNGPVGSKGVKLQSSGLSPTPLREPDRIRSLSDPKPSPHRHPRDVRIISRDFH